MVLIDAENIIGELYLNNKVLQLLISVLIINPSEFVFSIFFFFSSRFFFFTFQLNMEEKRAIEKRANALSNKQGYALEINFSCCYLIEETFFIFCCCALGMSQSLF